MKYMRPISPYLTYKVELHTVLSIMHRITGVALSVALCLFVVLGKYYSTKVVKKYGYYSFLYELNGNAGIILSALGLLILFGTVYHFCTGIRHLLWDFLEDANVYEIHNINLSCYIIAGSVTVLTTILWLVI